MPREIQKIAPGAKNSRSRTFASQPSRKPDQVIGTPVNYLKHVEEAAAQREVFTGRYQGGIEEQGLFLKATSSLVGRGRRREAALP